MKNKNDSKSKNNYVYLRKGLCGLICRDKDPFRKDLFNKYLECNLRRSITYSVINSNRFFKILGVIFYYLFNLLSIKLNERKDFVTMIVHSSEVRDLNHCIIHKENISQVKKSFLWFFNFQNVSIDLFQFKKLIRIFKLLLKRYDSYIVLRAAEYMAYYSKFYILFKEISIKGVLIFTDSNPHGFALLSIAHRLKIPAYFISSNGEPHPPLVQIQCKGAFLLGENSLKMYKTVKSRFDKVFYKGHKQDYKKFKNIHDNQDLTLGLFLGKMSTLKYLNFLLPAVSKKMNIKNILVRIHPNLKFNKNNNLHKLLPGYLALTDSTSFIEDIEKCDLILSGNTSALLEALLFGKASLFCRELEKKYYDVYGYVQDGLAICWNKDLTLKEINNFYASIDLEKINKRLDLSQSFNASVKDFNSYVFNKINGC